MKKETSKPVSPNDTPQSEDNHVENTFPNAKPKEKKATRPSPIELFEEGRKYEEGIDVEQDLKKALDLYRRASRRGCLEAKFQLGMMQLEGKGCKRDIWKAMAHIVEASNKGYLPAKKKVRELKRSPDKDISLCCSMTEFNSRLKVGRVILS